jgi:hypothetical protein
LWIHFVVRAYFTRTELPIPKDDLIRSAMIRAIAFFGLIAAVSVQAASDNVMKGHQGYVTHLDENAHSLTVEWKRSMRIRNARTLNNSDSREVTFQTTPETTFTVGNEKAPGSWADLKKGARVKVTDHNQGSLRVAETVQVLPPKHK